MNAFAKTYLSAAIAAVITSAANAVPVLGTVTDLQITSLTTDYMAHPNAYVDSHLVIGGDTVTGLTLTGRTVGYSADSWVSFEWNLTNGIRLGVNGSGGTIFVGGELAIATSSDNITFDPFWTIDASVDNLEFLAGYDGPITPAPQQVTAGLVVDDAGYGTLPGLWDLTYFGSGWNNAAGQIYTFGGPVGFFMEGSVAPVPVPAAAWLFGSAMLGLMGIKRQRTMA